MKDILKGLVYVGLFAVPFITLYVENDYFFPFITGKNFWFRILVDITFAAWILLAFHDAKFRPKISGVVWSFGALLVVMFLANFFGKHPDSSFWSNFERMDGYVSLVHTFLYMLILGSVLQTKIMWKWFLNISLLVAFVMALVGLSQFAKDIGRIDSQLGNAAYMSIYMLFHIFIAFWLMVETKDGVHKLLYGSLIAMFTFILIETGTRGTAVGLAVGVMVMSAYIGLFGAQFKQYRKYAIGGFAVLLIAVGAFVMGKDSAIVQNNPNLSRIANISLQDLEIRGIIWGLAWDGVKERPLLGYGQSNFNYVFNQNYDPRLYGQEQWFDRAHNIFIDWLIAGGFLGLIAYLSIFGWCLYYLFYRPLVNKEDHAFTVMERGVLLGILAGYFTHNLVVFDNIVSYIFFAVILALINSRVGLVPERIAKYKVDLSLINQFVAPVVAVGLVAGIYFYHVPGMQASGDLIDAFRANTPEKQLELFELALSRESFAYQEITEQLAQASMNLAQDPKASTEVKEAFASTTEKYLFKLVEAKPDDARVYVFVGSYYRSIGDLEKAKEYMALARKHSPNKQAIIIQQAFVAFAQNDFQTAVDFLNTALTLDENNLEAREYYAGSLLYIGNSEAFDQLMTADDEVTQELIMKRFAYSDFVISSASQFGRYDILVKLFEYRVNEDGGEEIKGGNDPQNWATLAYLHYKNNENDKAIDVLNRGKERLPNFAQTATCFADNITNGKEPQEGCVNNEAGD